MTDMQPHSFSRTSLRDECFEHARPEGVPQSFDRRIHHIRSSTGSEFGVVPSIGQFQPGHCLVLPKQSVTAFAQLPANELGWVQRYFYEVRQLIGDHYGSPIIAEHGTGLDEPCTAACVREAHMHFIPMHGRHHEVAERYWDAGGPPDEIVRNLGTLRDVCGNNAYVLLKTETSSGFYVWFAVEKFDRQFVRRVCAETLGVGAAYNWRAHPFVEMTQFTADSLRSMFENHSFTGFETLPVQTARDVYGDLPSTYLFRGLGPANPHIALQEETSLPLLLNLAWSRSEHCSEAALDRLRVLASRGGFENGELRAIAMTARQVLESDDHSVTARHAAAELLSIQRIRRAK